MSDYSKLNYDDYVIWQDKDIRFDVPKNQLALRVGEKIIDNLENIEDTKGCNGDIGTMMLTNLRMIWFCQTNVKINLTIGLDCILSSEVKQTSSKVIGETTAIYIKCRFNNNRFEFVFNSLTNTNSIFVSFNNIYKAYDSTRLYREMKLKGFLTQDKNLIMLPEEQILNKISAVSNLQSDQAVAGVLYITNVRITWFSNNIENYNLSLPWIQIKNLKPKDHVKFGKAVSIETNKQLGTNNIMFKFNGGEIFENLIKELVKFHLKYLENPLLGVDFNKLDANNQTQINNASSSINVSENKDKKSSANAINNMGSLGKLSIINEINESKLEYSALETNKNIESNFNSGKLSLNNDNANNNVDQEEEKREKFNHMLNDMNDEVEIIHTNYFNEQPTMLHYITSNQEKRNTINDIMYCPEFGISVERLPDGVTVDSLWKIILN